MNQKLPLRRPLRPALPVITTATDLAVRESDRPLATVQPQAPVPEPKPKKQKPPLAHDWEPNLWESSPSCTCKRCGVTLAGMPSGNIGSPQKFHYSDAAGRQINTMVELGCPVFVGDTNGTLAETKDKVRHVGSRVDGVENRVDSVEDRLSALETENAELRTRLDAKIELDVSGLVEWLSEMALLHLKNQLPTVPATVTGVPLALPAPVAALVIEVGKLKERQEAVLIPVQSPTEKK